MLVGFLERKICEVLPQPTRFQSPQIGEKIERKRMSFALFIFQTKLPSAIKCWSYLFFHFWSFSFLNVGLVFFCMGPFQCYVVWVSPIFFFIFFFFFFLVLVCFFSHQTPVLGFYFYLFIIIIILVLDSWIIKFPFIHYLF